MKVQLEIDSELWGRFRSKVINEQGKTLAEVVPGVVEPAIREYLEPVKLGVVESLSPEQLKECELPTREQSFNEWPIIDRVITNPPTYLKQPSEIRRCEMCDSVTERLFSLDGRKACYSCWKAAITAIPVPTPPAPPEAA